MAKKKKRLEKKVLIGEKRVSVYGFSAYEIQEKIEALRKVEERRKCPTFSTVADEWDDMHSKEVEFYTANCYVAPLKDVKAEFGEMLITDITYDDVKTYIKEYASLGYKKQTVKLRRSVIKQIYDYAIVKGYVQTNPAKGVKIPKNVKNGVRELPEESDIEKVKASVNEPFGLFPFLIMYTGARREEALAIQIKNIDLNKNIIRINQVVIFEIGETIVRKYTKTDAGMRDVPILLPLRKELEKIVKMQIQRASFSPARTETQ